MNETSEKIWNALIDVAKVAVKISKVTSRDWGDDAYRIQDSLMQELRDVLANSTKIILDAKGEQNEGV